MAARPPLSAPFASESRAPDVSEVWPIAHRFTPLTAVTPVLAAKRDRPWLAQSASGRRFNCFSHAVGFRNKTI